MSEAEAAKPVTSIADATLIQFPKPPEPVGGQGNGGSKIAQSLGLSLSDDSDEPMDWDKVSDKDPIVFRKSELQGLSEQLDAALEILERAITFIEEGEGVPKRAYIALWKELTGALDLVDSAYADIENVYDTLVVGGNAVMKSSPPVAEAAPDA